jgi:hypothetical protein
MADNEFNPYEQKQAARKERLEDLAERLKAESDSAYQTARRMASIIPMGQPILVGHHSEGRDRRYRARIWKKQDQACELAAKAKHFQEKAASVGTGGISSDDPEAVDKLRSELAKLEAMQEKMKQANALVRKNDRAGLSALGFSETRISQLFTPDFCGRIGFPDYALTNNGANIRRIRKRIEELQTAPTDTTERQEGDITIREDAAENRVMLIFPDKPSDEVRAILKSSGFKWSPNRGAWVRVLNNAGRAAAKYALSKITGASKP